MANPLKRRRVDPANCTLIEYAYARTGSMLKAARVLAFITAWDAVRRQLGRRPSVDEYATFWKEHRATAFRHMALFHDVFPGAESPDVVLDQLQAAQRSITDRNDWPAIVTAAPA